ncbi:MAG: co-chaperone GroES [Planctomycetes bacterium]|nr:co-chaperone GroES [Planctomycetota bacterium]MCA8936511.1 co-chaperone GroES [Planctomycetota bacterium]
MATKLRPLDDNVIVKPHEAEEKTAGGIVLPDTAKEKPLRGVVISVGPGHVMRSGKRVEPSVKKGDVVMFGKYSGSDVKVDGIEHKILREAEILAIIE